MRARSLVCSCPIGGCHGREARTLHRPFDATKNISTTRRSYFVAIVQHSEFLSRPAKLADEGIGNSDVRPRLGPIRACFLTRYCILLRRCRTVESQVGCATHTFRRRPASWCSAQQSRCRPPKALDRRACLNKRPGRDFLGKDVLHSEP